MTDHTIRPGQTYRRHDPVEDTITRIRVVGEPGTTPGRYSFGKVDIVTLTEDGREIRRRAIECRKLRDSPTTKTGKPRRTGYVLEQPATARDAARQATGQTTGVCGTPWTDTHGYSGDCQTQETAAETRAAVGQPAEARPPIHRWAAELHDPLANEWIPGTRYLVRDRALAALAHAREIAPAWKDSTPVERRLVRETTTWTVEETP